MLITSRPYAYIENDIRQVNHTFLRLEDESHNLEADIIGVVEIRLGKLKPIAGCSMRKIEKIKPELIARSDYTFKWVSIALDLLEKSPEAFETSYINIMSQMPLFFGRSL